MLQKGHQPGDRWHVLLSQPNLIRHVTLVEPLLMSVWGYVANKLVDCDTLHGIWMYMHMSHNCRIRGRTHASVPLLTHFLSIAFFFFFFSKSINLFTAAVFLHIQNVLIKTNIRRWEVFRWSLLSKWWSIKLADHWVCSVHCRRPTRNRSVAFPVYSIHIQPSLQLRHLLSSEILIQMCQLLY